MTAPHLGFDLAGGVAAQDHVPSTDADELVPPLLQGDPQDPAVKAALVGLYGSSFPYLRDTPQERDWVEWATSLWTTLEPGMYKRLREVERNRLYRKGFQWISSNGKGPWTEPPKPTMAARPVMNLIAPALDQRVEIVSEQRPGFRARPSTQDPNDLKRAEAIQAFLEYQFDQQERPKLIREIAYWVGTDGCCFEELYWHPDRGPWDADVGSPLGDPCPRIRRIETVRVAPNATANQDPYYWVIRDLIPKETAVAEYGAHVAENMEVNVAPTAAEAWGWGLRTMGLGGVWPDELFRDREMVARYTIYCDKSQYLPQGLTLIVVGGVVAFCGPLLVGRVPMVRWTDGSTDPAFFPEPLMNLWVPHQTRMNAILAKFVENLRYNAGPRIIAKENAIKGETLQGGTMSVISVAGLGGLSENMQVVQGMSVSPDVDKGLQLERKAFEDLTGWNDTTRGSFSADQSGRAILAVREQVERVFAPLVVAASESQVEWAKITLEFGKRFYDLPRMIAVQGHSRPDLARAISAPDLEGAVDVWIDPETLMPMPRSLRLFLMKDMVQMGIMSPQEYRRRSVFAWVRNLGSPDEDQEARARRVVESIRQGQPLPMLWQDDEAIHQDVLERELILPDDTDPAVRQGAQQRWSELAQQSQQKMGGGPPPGPPQGPQTPGPGGPGGPPSNPLQLSPAEQPFQGTNPGIAASTGTQLGQLPEGEAQSRLFDPTQPF